MKIYNKLVRDKIPQIIKESGKSYEIEFLEDDIYFHELKRKLVEESKELLVAEDSNEILEELADVFEVLDAIKEHLKINDESVNEIRDNKNNKRGSFNERIFLKKVF